MCCTIEPEEVEEVEEEKQAEEEEEEEEEWLFPAPYDGKARRGLREEENLKQLESRNREAMLPAKLSLSGCNGRWARDPTPFSIVCLYTAKHPL